MNNSIECMVISMKRASSILGIVKREYKTNNGIMVAFYSCWCSLGDRRGIVLSVDLDGSSIVFWPVMSSNREQSSSPRIMVPFLNYSCVGSLSKHEIGTLCTTQQDPIVLSHNSKGETAITFTFGVMDNDGFLSTGSDYA